MIRFLLMIFICGWVFSVNALPLAVEADRLAIRAKSALEAKNYVLAYSSLVELERLGAPLPQSFYYLKGLAQNGVGRYNGAKISLEKYLQIAGAAGKYYKESLVAYNLAEQEGERVISEYNAARLSYENAVREHSRLAGECNAKLRKLFDKMDRQIEQNVDQGKIDKTSREIDRLNCSIALNIIQPSPPILD